MNRTQNEDLLVFTTARCVHRCLLVEYQMWYGCVTLLQSLVSIWMRRGRIVRWSELLADLQCRITKVSKLPTILTLMRAEALLQCQKLRNQWRRRTKSMSSGRHSSRIFVTDCSSSRIQIAKLTRQPSRNCGPESKPSSRLELCLMSQAETAHFGIALWNPGTEQINLTYQPPQVAVPSLKSPTHQVATCPHCLQVRIITLARSNGKTNSGHACLPRLNRSLYCLISFPSAHKGEGVTGIAFSNISPAISGR